MRAFKTSLCFLSAVLLLGLWAVPLATAQEKPQRGGHLNVALAGDPPSLDMHQESTFLVQIPMAPAYNNLIEFDPHNYPNIVGDVAKSWTVSDDHLAYTFTLHQGVKFHDGSELTSADVKASFDRIVSPPEGVVSPRRSYYVAVKRIEAPDPYTVVFRLHYPSPSFLSMVANPFNWILSKKYLDQDPNYYRLHEMGSGPFKLKKYVRGSYIEMERNPDYWKKGLPYMDGITYFIIKDTSARANAIRSGRADVEFRGLPPADVDNIKKDVGDKVVVAYPRALFNWGVGINVDKKPFDDERVRKAMTLAIDRYDMAKTLAPLTGLETVGGLLHPDTPWALSGEELQALPGYGKDHQANLREAKRLLAEAGYPHGFQTVLTNRNVKLPYIDLGVYLISSWKKIGVEAEHKIEESATWSKTRLTRDFELLLDPYGSTMVGDPDELMVKFVGGSSTNFGRFREPVADALFEQQKTEINEQKRIQLVKEMQKAILEKAWWIPALWWTRAEVRSARIRNYEPLPAHHQNRRLEDVWLAEK
ncbi:MAG TPA: ABC transporter substrate-binding protein [Alphaproteobacteria bacterium]|nr:ABC transporter substrate-binding protein [Alphaproteobacteria bacterium]